MHRKGSNGIKRGFLWRDKGNMKSKGLNKVGRWFFVHLEGVRLHLKGFLCLGRVLCLGKGKNNVKRGLLYIGGGILCIGRSPNALERWQNEQDEGSY